jgi:hypothetical protein
MFAIAAGSLLLLRTRERLPLLLDTTGAPEGAGAVIETLHDVEEADLVAPTLAPIGLALGLANPAALIADAISDADTAYLPVLPESLLVLARLSVLM